MSNARTIEIARAFLNGGQYRAYARTLSSAIRSTGSLRSSSQIRRAILDDGMTSLFRDYDTANPAADERGAEVLEQFVEMFRKLSPGSQERIYREHFSEPGEHTPEG